MYLPDTPGEILSAIVSEILKCMVGGKLDAQ
jgi:hypothetical protein